MKTTTTYHAVIQGVPMDYGLRAIKSLTETLRKAKQAVADVKRLTGSAPTAVIIKKTITIEFLEVGK